MISVILNTYERPVGLMRAIDAVLGQTMSDFEVVIVDDGSSDSTSTVLATVVDPRVALIRQENCGLAVARNAGARSARREWLVFLDDDDTPHPNWLETLSGLMSEDVGVVCCGARLVSPDGRRIGSAVPYRLGKEFGGVRALFLAGTFGVRADAFWSAGGYVPGMPTAHQTELALRVVPQLSNRGWRVRCTEIEAIDIERRAADNRVLSTPSLHFAGSRWLMTRHREILSHSRRSLALAESIAGVSAFQLNRVSDARRHFARAIRTNPLSARGWARLLASSSVSVAERIWKPMTNIQSPLPRVRELHDLLGLEDLLFLPPGYVTNSAQSSDRDGTPFWAEGLSGNDVRYQVPVYRLAARLVRRLPVEKRTVLDVGCGSGHKLIRYLSPAARVVGADQPSGIALAQRAFPDFDWIEIDLMDERQSMPLTEVHAGLVICSDVVEHVADPYRLLELVRDCLDDDAIALISTPDRSRLRGSLPYGPPGNPRHIREWSASEFELLLEAAGLEVCGRRHLLPRAYSVNTLELKRVVHRLVHFRPVPDSRHSMAFIVRKAPS